MSAAVTIDDSILGTVRKMVVGREDDTTFDTDLVIHINTVFDVLYQVGIGTEDPFFIIDDSAIWSDFIDGTLFRSVLSFMVLRVKMLFDPPQSSFVLSSMKEQSEELLVRMTYETTIAEMEGRL